MKKLIALIVSLCMLVSMLPAVAETPAETKKVASVRHPERRRQG